MEAQLILENGMRFSGKLFGAEKNIVGEIVFTTGMGGYQEALTDPANSGLIVTMTFPLVGNYGINLEDMEADNAKLKALVVREKCDYPSNFRNEMNLDDFLKEQGIIGLEGVDTRAITRIIRDNGTMKACIMTGNPSDEEAKTMMNGLDNSNLIMDATTEQVYTLNEAGRTKVAYIDLGTKKSMLEALTCRDCAVTVYPANIPSSIIDDANPDFVFISSGPGTAEDAASTVETVKDLVGKYPIFGIDLGNLVIASALGCTIDKLKFGHHGENLPVKDIETGKVYVTAQSHSQYISGLSCEVTETFKNVNDGTCAGIRHKNLPIEGVQFHPEAAPGPLEMNWIFDRFLKEVK